MADLILKNLIKRYDNNHIVVNDVSLSVEAGELVSLLGPSGCGKTTILRMISGLLLPDQGSINIRGIDSTGLPPYKRDIGMVFQNYALFPHMTVLQNVSFGLQMRKMSGAKIKEKVEKALAMVNLSGFGDRYPRNLSGGQQQRVALARALVLQPAVLLLDEPLSALDAKLRHETREEIRRLQKEMGLATVFVTHDQEEALTMSDRIVILNQGVVQQFAEPSVLFERPVNEFVARFMGIPNVFSAKRTGHNEYSTNDGMLVRATQDRAEVASIGIRPERIYVGQDSGPLLVNRFIGTVTESSYNGTFIRMTIGLESGQSFVAAVPSNTPAANLNIGEKTSIGWEAHDTLMLLPEAK